MTVCLDTNAYSDWLRERAWVDLIPRAERILLPAVVLGELREGFLGGSRGGKNEKTLQEVMGSAAVEILRVNEETSVIYAELKFFLRQQGTPIPTNDIWIGACSVQHGATLLTRDRHFDFLPQLRVRYPED